MLTEALLAAITEAVFSFLLEKTGLTEKVQAWLGRDPQRLAFQVALARAFPRFAHAYPQWIESLFDEHFLTHQAASLLARTLVRTNMLTPAELATAWADQMGLNERQRTQFIAELTPVASNFLRWLDAELRTRREFQPLFDSRTLDTIAESSQQTLEALEQVRTELNNAFIAFANECGWLLRELRESLIDEAWIARRPRAAPRKGWPVSFACLWQQRP